LIRLCSTNLQKWEYNVLVFQGQLAEDIQASACFAAPQHTVFSELSYQQFSD
jgi:hypothetical protein